MKGSVKLHELQEQEKKLEGWVKPQACIICTTKTSGAYGMWSDGWTCSKKCEDSYVSSLLHRPGPPTKLV